MDWREYLFEPVKIGAKTAKNRLFVSPYGLGTGWQQPALTMQAREQAAIGGWAVVSTEQAEIQKNSDMSPGIELRFRSEKDYEYSQKLVERLRSNNALAAIELSHSGANVGNETTWSPSISPSNGLVSNFGLPSPYSAIEATHDDLQSVVRSQYLAAQKAAELGFDIIYVYAVDYLSLPGQFLSPDFNARKDCYGGHFRARCKLLFEMVNATHQAIKNQASIAVRLTLDLLIGTSADENFEYLFSELSEKVDYWDLVYKGGSIDSSSDRIPRGLDHLKYLELARKYTSKPIGSVGLIRNTREFSSIQKIIEREVVDVYPFARASISDPYLPTKIREENEEAIIHCVKCNFCVSRDIMGVPVRCTQNPSFGFFPDSKTKQNVSPKKVAVVGAGPAGLEAAAKAQELGHDVTIFEMHKEVGGRILFEKKYLNQNALSEVVSTRLRRLEQCGGIKINLSSRVDDVSELAKQFQSIILATGSRWDTTGKARLSSKNIMMEGGKILSPDAAVKVYACNKTWLIYDEEGEYSALAVLEHANIISGSKVFWVTPHASIAPSTDATLESHHLRKVALESCEAVFTEHEVTSISSRSASANCIYTGKKTAIQFDYFVHSGARIPNKLLFTSFINSIENDYCNVLLVGDAKSPRQVAHAIRSGYEAAFRV